MGNLMRLSTLALALMFSGAALAQSDGENTASETEAAPAEAEAPAADGIASDGGDGVPGLSMGVDEGANAGPYVKDTFGDWQLRCVRDNAESEVCQLYQLMRDGEGNSVAEFNMFPLPEGKQAVAGANIVTPLETLLTANLRLAIDGGQARVYPYSFCSQIGCFSRIGLTAEELAQFRAGNAATITIVPAAAPNETVQLSLSLSGFTAGYNALQAAE